MALVILGIGDLVMKSRALIFVLGLVGLALGGGFLAIQARWRPEGEIVKTDAPLQQAKPGPAQKPAPVSDEILANAKLYMEAYNRQDAKAIVALCPDDCEFIDRDGVTMRAHKEIEDDL